MARVSSFLIRYFSNYYTLHRSHLAVRAAPLDPRLTSIYNSQKNRKNYQIIALLACLTSYTIQNNVEFMRISFLCHTTHKKWLNSHEHFFSISARYLSCCCTVRANFHSCHFLTKTRT